MTSFVLMALAQAGGQTRGPDFMVWAILAVAIIVALVFFAVMAQFINLWVQAMLSGAKVDMLELVGMRLRKVDPRIIVLAYIRTCQAKVAVSTKQLEAHHLAGGHVTEVTTALIAARKGGVELSWEEICAADLAGRDIAQEVKALVQLKAKGGGTAG
jgi:uncharacterized protein YqfA (UPF0365 family)